MRTTVIMNLKGGTGKTVTAINTGGFCIVMDPNTGAILAHDHDQAVLLIDADSQANLTEFVSRAPADRMVIGGMTDLLKGLDAHPAPSKIPGVWLLPADEKLMALDVTSAGNGQADPMALAEFLNTAESDTAIDWCIIDCPPAFNAAAMAALIAADEVVIPVKLDAFGIRGLSKILEQIRNMRKINPGLEIAGVLPTMYYADPTQRDAEQKLRMSLTAARIRMFHHIRRSTRVDDMTFAQSPLIVSSPKSKATHDYKVFARDLMDLAEGGAV